MEIELTSEITVRLVQKVGGDAMVIAAAKVSTSGEEAIKFAEPGNEEANAGLINYLMKCRHGSCYEHSSMTFFIHAPIFVWREFHRHRIMSYNETSGRYSELKPIFWIPSPERKMIPSVTHKSARPDFVAGTPAQMAAIKIALERSYSHSYAVYKSMLDFGFAKEVARACLPVAIYSSCWVTCNPRSLMHFLSLRTHDDKATYVSYPQAEIEQAARQMEAIFAEGWPITYKAFVANGRVGP